jgi:Kdo2-lipid IVA lauroyltransferase/acyltransferase
VNGERRDTTREKRNNKRAKKGKFLQVFEFMAVYALLVFCRLTPLKVIHMVSTLLGNLCYLFVPRRRSIAVENLRHAYTGERGEKEVKTIARKSCISFFLTFLETSKFQSFLGPDLLQGEMRKTSQNLEELFQKAKRIHEEANGCIFVTPHIGNWELLPHVSAVVGIPLVVIVRPLDNTYLEKLIYKKRAESGQLIIPKRNAMFALQKTLRQGKSVGMLPDQSTMHGIPVSFFGRKATTTPIPAILSITYGRPIVVVSCCRSRDGYHFEGVVSDPIWPEAYESEKEEIFRLTTEMNKKMESIIRSYPEQYLWMHNRWKTYKHKKRIMLS